MRLLYERYKIYVYIKKLKAYKLKFKNSFTLYYHKLYDNNWNLDSYIKIYTFNNIAKFFMLYNCCTKLNNGMYFLMKNNIKPIYETKENINGGYMSIKVSEKEVNKLWLYLSLDFVGNTLSNKNIVNGLSISYKKKFYIIKIWIKNKKYKNITNLNINSYNLNNILYNNFIN